MFLQAGTDIIYPQEYTEVLLDSNQLSIFKAVLELNTWNSPTGCKHFTHLFDINI